MTDSPLNRCPCGKLYSVYPAMIGDQSKCPSCVVEEQREAEMSTLNRADDCQKILDNGRVILIFKNEMGSYTARAMDEHEFVTRPAGFPERITDDSTPSQALYRLTEKFTTGRIA